MSQKNWIELFTVDLNYDSLKDYMSDMIKVINQQGKTINDMQNQMKNFTTKDQISKNFQCLAETIEYMDPELKKLACQQNMPELTGDEFMDSVSILTNKLSMLTNGQETVYLKERDNSRHIQKNKENIQLKSDEQWVQDKIDKARIKIQNDIETNLKLQKRKIDDVDYKFDKIYDEIKVQIKDTEKKTIWKIDECQKIVVQKVNKEYVDSACALFNEQVQKQVIRNQQESLDKLNTDILRNQDRINQLDQLMDNLNKKQVLSIESLKSELYNTMVTESNMKTFIKNLEKRIDDIKKEIQIIENQGNPQEYYKKCKDLIQTQQEQIFDQERHNLKVKQQVQDYSSKFAVIEDKLNFSTQVKSGLHQHDICQVDGELQNIKNTVKELKQFYNENNTLTSQKLGAIEMNVLNTIANKRQDSNQALILKEDILFTVDRLYGPYNDKIKEVKNKVENILYTVREIANHVQFNIS